MRLCVQGGVCRGPNPLTPVTTTSGAAADADGCAETPQSTQRAAVAFDVARDFAVRAHFAHSHPCSFELGRDGSWLAAQGRRADSLPSRASDPCLRRAQCRPGRIEVSQNVRTWK